MLPARSQHVGVTVLPEYIQSEGAEMVLDNIARMHATAVTTSPYVASLAPQGKGEREPPSDAGQGFTRLLDRPLWGKRELWMHAAPSFCAQTSLYKSTLYHPDKPTDLTRNEGGQIRDFMRKAKARNLRTYLQIMAAIPPSYRVQFGGPSDRDQPMLPNGSPLPKRVDRNATLASADLRAYMSGLIQDLVAQYPECDGLRFDWPEYPPYHFLSMLADYNPQVAPYAKAIGLDLSHLAQGVIEACPNSVMRQAILDDLPPAEMFALVRNGSAAMDDHFRLRAHLVRDFQLFIRREVDKASGGRMRVFLQGFPPPWNDVSGFVSDGIDDVADDVAIKFYTMHWPMIGLNHARYAANMLTLPEAQLQRYFRRHIMGTTATEGDPVLAYPGPEQGHGVSSKAISNALKRFGHSETIAVSHGYGPIDDVVLRCRAALQGSSGKIEFNRYAYLADEKITQLGRAIEEFASEPA